MSSGDGIANKARGAVESTECLVLCLAFHLMYLFRAPGTELRLFNSNIDPPSLRVFSSFLYTGEGTRKQKPGPPLLASFAATSATPADAHSCRYGSVAIV